MTTEEFSNEFDVLINAYSTLDSPLNFDEYEKSIFLTKAQEELVEGLYTGKALGDSFEDTEQIRRYLDSLVKTVELTCSSANSGLSTKSVVATLPDDIWFITYESATLQSDNSCINNKQVQVIPVTQDEYHRIKGNPFRRPNSRKVLRLDIGKYKVELISEEAIKSYLVRYLSRPNPIILLDLPENLKINKLHTKTECELNPGIHKTILELAVNLAIKSRVQSSGK